MGRAQREVNRKQKMACGWDCYGCKFHELSRNDHTITGCHVTFAKLP